MLGQSFLSTFVRAGAQVLAPTHQEIDITNEISVRKFITTHKPHYVINCVAYTDVDGCEKDPTKAYIINSDAVEYMSSATKKVKGRFIHFSTDYVFDGNTQSPYDETHVPNPLQIYGKSKLEGEERALSNGGSVFRVQWLFGQGKQNFVDWVAKTILEKRKIRISEIQAGSPCSTLFISNMVCVYLPAFKPEIYHIAHENYATRIECAKYIGDYFKVDYRDYVEPMSGVSFGIASRPVNTSLCANKMKKQMGVHTMGTWQSDVLTYLTSRYNVWNP